MMDWIELGREIVGAPVEVKALGPALFRPAGSVWAARVQSAADSRLLLTVDLPLALALVDVSLGDPRGPGRRIRPLGEVEHGLLLAVCAQVFARVAAVVPVQLSVVAEAPGLAALGAEHTLCSRAHLVCEGVAGMVCLFGAAQDLPGPTVVVVDDELEPGDLILGAELGAPRPDFPAYVLGAQRYVAQWVDTAQGRGLRVLGRG